MKYDFAQLSYLDFEDICVDLLQAETGVRYEVFKPGRDGGIDARNIVKGVRTIVQCKHYVRSGYAQLLRTLEESELPKVARLAPDRYIVCTSVPLSAANKQEIIELFHPHIQSSADIYGQDDLNNLLRNNSDIETRNFKLWLSSGDVLTRVLHNAVVTRTEQLVERVMQHVPVFVDNRSVPDSIKFLNDTRMVLITGEPGVGKTTLADILLLRYIDEGYKPVEVTSAKDAYDVYNPEDKFIFYFDDFLGLSSFGDNSSNVQASDIVRLLQLVTTSNNARIILTSREFVIAQAMKYNERLANSGYLEGKYTLKLAVYTKLIRARILYNHLYFSRLAPDFIEALVSTKAYEKIVEHKHYTPRLIQWLTDPILLSGVSATEYPGHFFATLQNPKKLWEHPFKGLSMAGQYLMLLFPSLGASERASVVEENFRALYSFVAKKYAHVHEYGAFQSALKEVLGTFLTIDRSLLGYQNPSIKDFLEDKVAFDKDIALDLIESAVQLEQLEKIWKLLSYINQQQLRALSDAIILSAERLKGRPHTEKLDLKDGVFWISVDLSMPRRMQFFFDMLAVTQDERLRVLITETAVMAEAESYIPMRAVEEWSSLARYMARYAQEVGIGESMFSLCGSKIREASEELGGIEDLETLVHLSEIEILPEIDKSLCRDLFKNAISQQKFLEEYRSESSSSQIAEYQTRIESLSKTLELDASDIISDLESRHEEALSHEEERADYDYESYQESSQFLRSEDSEIQSMFETLREH